MEKFIKVFNKTYRIDKKMEDVSTDEHEVFLYIHDFDKEDCLAVHCVHNENAEDDIFVHRMSIVAEELAV